jgi:leader peptidase (prepilin peptidase)/N-methyltransferase
MPIWLPALFAALLGAVIGSFLNVCIVRWPEGESVVRPPSRCPRCGRQVRWYENVPVLSWLLLRARCAGCGLPISALYPAIELLTALGWLSAELAFGPTFEALRVAVFGTVLLGIAATDARRYLIPDGFTVFLLLWGLATSMIAWGMEGPTLFAGPYDALVGACAGAGAIAIVGWLGERVFKKEAMGFGDVTMMAGVGAALGPSRALLTVIVGAFLGAVASVTILVPAAYMLHRRRTAGAAGGTTPDGEGAGRPSFEPPLVPFGVFLAPAAFLTLVWGERMIAWYFTNFVTRQ